MAEITLSSDEDAWNWLDELLSMDENVADENVPEPIFNDWPVLNLKTKKGKSEIDAFIMRGLVDYQKAFWRSYLTLSSGTRNLQRIEENDKNELLLPIRIGDGSSKMDVDLTKVLEKVGKKLAKKLSARDIKIIVLIIALTFAGQSVWKKHISENAKVRLEKIKQEDTKALLEAFAKDDAQETERMKILERAFNSVPESRVAEAEAGPARQELLRSMPPEHDVSIESIELPSTVLKEIIKPERRATEDVTVTRAYFIDRAQSSSSGFQVRLRDVETDEAISAHFGEALSSIKERQLVEKAFFEKRSIVLTLEARQRGDLIVSAIIKSAEQPRSN